MNSADIQQLLWEGVFPYESRRPELIETHISWVFLGEVRVYKIQKPVHYTFLDFSTLEKRRSCCEREVVFNRRLTEDIYLGVVPICFHSGRWIVDGNTGTVEDYAVCMRRMDPARRMDLLLDEGMVTAREIARLADVIARFHLFARVCRHREGPCSQELFNDLGGEADFLEGWIPGTGTTIRKAIAASDEFLRQNAAMMRARMRSGFYRDGHGDLHMRNIFLLAKPQVFDCIEFNDSFRRIDILNDVAFLCMDLDACGRQDLSALFFKRWNSSVGAAFGEADHRLFLYYKAYRANIRAKVYSLRARSAALCADRNDILAEVRSYLLLMQHYLTQLKKAPAF